MQEMTVIYYTSNRENEAFESKIRQRLLDVIGDTPLISVSQKPIEFGENICVGDIGANNVNLLKQLRIGTEAAKTKYVCTAEADCLYPPEYFSFRPEDNSIYRGENIYILWDRGKFHPKGHLEGVTVAERQAMLDSIDDGSYCVPKKCKRFKLGLPVITFRTNNGMHRKAPYSSYGATDTLPYWGSVESLRKEFM